jgi:hypothetical protein
MIGPAALSATYLSGRTSSMSTILGSGLGVWRMAMPAAISPTSFSRTSPAISFERRSSTSNSSTLAVRSRKSALWMFIVMWFSTVTVAARIFGVDGRNDRDGGWAGKAAVGRVRNRVLNACVSERLRVVGLFLPGDGCAGSCASQSQGRRRFTRHAQ